MGRVGQLALDGIDIALVVHWSYAPLVWARNEFDSRLGHQKHSLLVYGLLCDAVYVAKRVRVPYRLPPILKHEQVR